MKLKFRCLLFTFVFILCGQALALRGGRAMGSRRNPDKTAPFEWPGRYLCEQCTGSPGGCWKYELTIYRDEEKEHRGQVSIAGPDGTLELKARVRSTPSTELVEFHYVEPVDTEKPAPAFAKDALLVALQKRDDDILLRFRDLPSHIHEQTAITCEKGK